MNIIKTVAISRVQSIRGPETPFALKVLTEESDSIHVRTGQLVECAFQESCSVRSLHYFRCSSHLTIISLQSWRLLPRYRTAAVSQKPKANSDCTRWERITQDTIPVAQVTQPVLHNKSQQLLLPSLPAQVSSLRDAARHFLSPPQNPSSTSPHPQAHPFPAACTKPRAVLFPGPTFTTETTAMYSRKGLSQNFEEDTLVQNES